MAVSDEMDVVQLAADVMERRGYSVVRRGTLLEHPDSGLSIKTVLLDSYPVSKSFHSVTAVTTSHPRLIPHGVFEYQHATGTTVVEAVREGFDQWVQIDFAVFIDALLDPLEYCQGIEIAFQQAYGSKLRRRAVLGPVGHAVLEPPPSDAEHPFCSCCFLTNTWEAFKPLIESDSFYGIRLFAARGQDGSPQADCRVNGQEWEDGKRALLAYVETWPQRGLESAGFCRAADVATA